MPRTPTGLGDDSEPVDRPSGRSNRPSPLIGTWRVFILIDSGYDIQEWVTTWKFSQDLRCSFERSTYSYIEGIRRVVNRTCTYVDQNSTAIVTYSGNAGTQSLPYSVPLNSPNRLILEGIEYERIS